MRAGFRHDTCSLLCSQGLASGFRGIVSSDTGCDHHDEPNESEAHDSNTRSPSDAGKLKEGKNLVRT
ncbi:hypothetical protein CCR75_002289 [Bremia lactucae]|uniref:Uncharacterized protein n=1 Tax=Bremia lactucae TaxID=4779 RepID=A0A976FLU1_BRELC|nr:hypothetical protein CCR75_002289 [Bremia lactucae]